MSGSTSGSMRKRMFGVVIVLTIFGFLTLIVRLFALQIVDDEDYKMQAAKQQLKSVTISAERGVIYDRNMKKLAQSATVWTVFISPKEMVEEQIDTAAKGLAEILDVDKQKIIDKSKNKSMYYEVIKAKVEKSVADAVMAFVNDEKIKGVYLEKDNKRYYPYGSFASTVIGFTNMDNQGAIGLEAYYEKVLSGTPGKVVSIKNGWGTDMPFSYQQMYEASNGNSIVLTLDEVAQHFLEKHLETAIAANNIRGRAAGIIMDVTTGGILAMTTMPDFDLNSPREIKDPEALERLEGLEGDEYKEALGEEQFLQWRNKAVSDPYEPGSVFKLITGSSALDEGAVHVDDTFSCPGYIKVGPETIRCWKVAGHGGQDFSDGLKNSCNPVFITVGQRLGADNFIKYFQNYGLSEKTGIDLPGEADNTNLIHHKYGIVELSSSSMGQTFKVTPIQLITAISAAVNGGTLYQPYLVKQILDSDGNIVKTIEPKQKRQIISKESSQLISTLAERVVSEGSGRNSYVPGYRIGGKTGTSEKIDLLNKTGQKKYVVSFLGFAPVDDPKIAVLVMLDEPELSNPYGSVIAAPVVGAVMSDVLPYLGIEPKFTAEELEKIDVIVPNVIGEKPHEGQSKLTEKALNARIVGKGDKILKQIPAEGQPIPRGGTVILYTELDEEVKVVEVPNVVGLSGMQANQAILNAGLNIKIMGSGIEGSGNYARKQSPEPGETVEPGTVITVEFINMEIHE